MEKPKDRDFIETVEGLLFCVVGYLHPPDRYTAYLKYCPVRNITVSSVPHTRVKTYYHPRRRLHSILEEGAGDPLEQRLIDLVNLLTDLSGLREGDLGVTGSLLTGSHNPEFSDIDLTVYGFKASQRLKAALIEAKREGEDIQPYSHERMLEWSRSRSRRFPLSFEELMGIAERRWNYGVYRGGYFSIHPVRTDGEITERYGERIYLQRGSTTGTAEITDSRESIYLPAIYIVNNVEMEAEVETEVGQIISYEGLYCDIFDEGEQIKFEGILEEVSSDRDHYRVVIGGAGSRGGSLKPAH